MNTSKTLSRSATKQQSTVVAKYLIQKAAFFGTVKKNFKHYRGQSLH